MTRQPKELALYDGRDFIGTVIGSGRDWRTLDPRGNPLPGQFKSIKAAAAAVSCSMSCVPDTSGRRDNT